MKKINIIFILFLTSIIPINVQAIPSTYDFIGYTSSLDLTEIGITFNYTNSCDVQMSSRNSFVSSSTFDSTLSWKSPDSNTLGSSTLTGISNTSCLSYGFTSVKAISVDATSGYFESSWSVSHSADTGFVNTRTRFICDSPNDRTNFFVSNGSDSRGNCLYGTRVATTNQRIAFLNTLTTNYNQCGDLTDWSASGTCPLSFGASCTDCEKTSQYIYPINSSATGDVIYNITDNLIEIDGGGQQVEITFTLDIINTETQTITNLQTTTTNVVTALQNFNQAEGVLSLNPDTLYLLVLTFNTTKSGGLDYSFVSYGATINLSIFTFSPNFVCGAFTSCVNGSQSRVCVDSFGVSPDKIETRSCFSVPFFSNVLGFEQSFTDNVYICQKDWFLISCPDSLDTINVEFPVNWSVSGDRDGNGVIRQNYISMSSETATEGARSLKMWYIPQKPDEPVSDPGNSSNTVCGNKTVGDFPQTSTTFNETLFLETNISFPSPFIDVRFDVRKCQEPVLQFDYTGQFLNPCGKRCYAPNCTANVLGRYGIRLLDADTSEIVLDYFSDATNDWRSFIIDLSNVGLQVNHNYTLGIAVNPENIVDPNTHCLFMDNFRVNLREGAVSECDTICDGLDLLLAQQQGNSCVFTTVVNSPICAPDADTAQSFSDFEEVCIGTTLHFFNNETGLWDQTLNSSICLEADLVTDAETDATTPITGVEDALGVFSFITTPLFLYIIFSLIISGLLAGGIAQVTKGSNGVFEIFGIAMLVFMLFGTLPQIAIIPIWVAIVIVAVVSLLIASKLKSFGVAGG